MRNLNQSVLDSDKIGSMLFKLSLPAFMGMFVSTSYNVVITIVIGHSVGSLGIAGLSIVFPLQMFAMGVGQVTGIGGASLISRLIGAGHKNRAEQALGNAVTINIIVSLLLTAIGLANPDFWLRLSGSDDAILPYARDYMTIIFMGMILSTTIISFNGLTIAQGNTRLPMVCQICGAFLNIILDAVFIIWLNMGVKGAALGTVISQFVSVAIFLGYYLFRKSYLLISLPSLKPDFQIIKEILAVGISALASTLTSSIMGILFMRMLLGYGGDLAVSAFGILNRIMMFTIMPGMVIGQAMQPIVGFNYGAKRYDRIIKSLKIASISSTLICFAAFLILQLAPEPLIRIFTSDQALIEVGVYATHRVFLFIWVMGFLMIGTTTFQALGKAGIAFFTSLARSAIFLIPALYLQAYFWGLDGVWLALPVSDILTAFLIAVLLIPQIKSLRRKRDAENNELARQLEQPVD